MVTIINTCGRVSPYAVYSEDDLKNCTETELINNFHDLEVQKVEKQNEFNNAVKEHEEIPSMKLSKEEQLILSRVRLGSIEIIDRKQARIEREITKVKKIAEKRGIALEVKASIPML